jgi:carbonic anhydrase
MRTLPELFSNNRKWASRMEHDHPGFFRRLAAQQAPEFLWIGCSDSRVPANQIVDLMPGEVFVHRNIANVVDPADRNCLAVIQYALGELRVKHIMVVGHYRCGGVRAALETERGGLVDEWLASIRALHQRHRAFFDVCPGETARWDKLCELNVLEQARTLTQTAMVQEAWARGQDLAVHGWIYSVADGHLRDLDVTVTNAEEASTVFAARLVKLL